VEDLNNTLNFIEADFSQKEKDYLKMQLFKKNFDLNRLVISSVFEIFDGVSLEKNSTFITEEEFSPRSPKSKNKFIGKEFIKN
jgi:hypothetical protein